jgi:hypothetical protein
MARVAFTLVNTVCQSFWPFPKKEPGRQSGQAFFSG